MNYPIIIASDAKKTSIANTNAVVDGTMRVIMKSIQHHAAQGKFSVLCGCPRECLEEITPMLESIGYTVTNTTIVPDTEHVCLLIDWSA